jgi:hypothetical protein
MVDGHPPPPLLRIHPTPYHEPRAPSAVSLPTLATHSSRLCTWVPPHRSGFRRGLRAYLYGAVEMILGLDQAGGSDGGRTWTHLGCVMRQDFVPMWRSSDAKVCLEGPYSDIPHSSRFDIRDFHSTPPGPPKPPPSSANTHTNQPLEITVPTSSLTHTKHNIHIPLSTLHDSVLHLTLGLGFIHTDTLSFPHCPYDHTTAYPILLVPLFTASLRRIPSKDRGSNVSPPHPRPVLSRKNLTCTPRITGSPTQQEDKNASNAVVKSVMSLKIPLVP